MTVSPIPKGFHAITPYLVLPRLEGFLQFLQEAFDAQIVTRHGDADGVRHAEARIGDSMLMMGGARASSDAMPAGIYLYVPDVDATYRSAIAAGATSISEPQNHFYGDRSGGVKDDWGNTWWIGTHVEDVPDDEIERRMATRNQG